MFSRCSSAGAGESAVRGGVEASLESGRAVVGVIGGTGERDWLGGVEGGVLRGVNEDISGIYCGEWWFDSSAPC